MPVERGRNLQISFGKTRSAPTRMHGLITSHVTVKDLVTPRGAWPDCKAKLLAKFGRNDRRPVIGYTIQYKNEENVEPCSLA